MHIGRKDNTLLKLKIGFLLEVVGLLTERIDFKVGGNERQYEASEILCEMMEGLESFRIISILEIEG